VAAQAASSTAHNLTPEFMPSPNANCCYAAWLPFLGVRGYAPMPKS
jgi:hypothetical protein